MACVLCTATLLMRLANEGVQCTASIKLDWMLNMLIPHCRWQRWWDDRMVMVGHSEGRKGDDRFSTGITELHACRRNGFPGGLPLVDSSLLRGKKKKVGKKGSTSQESKRMYLLPLLITLHHTAETFGSYNFVKNLWTCSLSFLFY